MAVAVGVLLVVAVVAVAVAVVAANLSVTISRITRNGGRRNPVWSSNPNPSSGSMDQEKSQLPHPAIASPSVSHCLSSRHSRESGNDRGRFLPCDLLIQNSGNTRLPGGRTTKGMGLAATCQAGIRITTTAMGQVAEALPVEIRGGTLLLRLRKQGQRTFSFSSRSRFLAKLV